MGQILLEFDNTLKFSDIVMPLLSSSPAEAGENVLPNVDQMQTSVFGIQVPLIEINNTVIDFDCVHNFSLSCKGSVPTLSMFVEDKNHIIQNIDKPRQDNEVRIQILPRFENAYKKINMTFFITSIDVNNGYVSLSGTYKLPKFTSSRMEALGELDTYTLFKSVAMNVGLGFATNIAKGDDLRYSYCNNCSLLELLDYEITSSGKDNQMLDWWVDYWNNINLVDIYERYNSVDDEKDMMIWVAGAVKEVGIDQEVVPQQVVATFSDHPLQKNSELYVTDYTIKTTPQGLSGTDKVYSIYEDDNNEYRDYLIQDGDIKRDVFLQCDYLGEVYGEYNYLLQGKIREGLLQKINSEQIEITLQSPLLGVMRGHKVNFIKYVNNDLIENKLSVLEDANAISRDVKTNIPLDKYKQQESSNGQYRIDKTASGQYLVLGTEIVYNDGWKYILTLARPASVTPDIINIDEDSDTEVSSQDIKNPTDMVSLLNTIGGQMQQT